jgi:hypothetical protein
MSGAARLAESQGFADEGGVHELVHDHAVSAGEVTAQELRAVRDLSRAEVPLQVVLHFLTKESIGEDFCAYIRLYY